VIEKYLKKFLKNIFDFDFASFFLVALPRDVNAPTTLSTFSFQTQRVRDNIMRYALIDDKFEAHPIATTKPRARGS